MVQNNRIKSTTNHIVSTLQFARQTAAINNTQISACKPVADKYNCALTTKWQQGVALLEGEAKVSQYKIPSPPTKPHAPEKPTLVSVPSIKPKPKKPPFQPRAAVNACNPGTHCEWRLMTYSNPYNKVCPTTYKISATYSVYVPPPVAKTLYKEAWEEYRCSGGTESAYEDAPGRWRYYFHLNERSHTSQKAFKKAHEVADEYNSNIVQNRK